MAAGSASASHPLRAVLAGVHAGSCPVELNFHCHTTCSDGSLRPEQLGRQALAIGLRHLAVTDHHSTAALEPLTRWLSQQQDAGETVPTLWSGIEISCLLEGCLVHVLALGFEPDHPALAPYRQGRAPVGAPLRAGEVRRRIHDAGGLAAWYDYAMQPRWQPTPLVCESIAAQLDDLGLLRSCGTDTHGLELCGR